MTDNAWCYTRSTRVDRSLEALGAHHVTIRPHRPQTNGKAERFNRTLLEEWAYTKLYRSNEARLAGLATFIDFYNRRRPHTALGGTAPMDRVSTT
jgi:transposase InsO family protein